MKYNITKIMFRLTSFALSLAIVVMPNLALAQEVADDSQSISESQPQVEAVSTPVEGASSTEIIVPTDTQPSQQSEAVIQESETSQSVQDSVVGTQLEQTSNPQEQVNISSINSTSTQAVDEQVVEPVANEPVIDVVSTIVATSTEVVGEMPVEILEPQKEFAFEINGSAIATNEEPEWSKPLDKDDASRVDVVTSAPNIDIETPNVLNVSGACDDKFYVILIYKNELDYNNNPSSYIFNRAFECEGGQYSYDVKNLPFDLETGTFYLMVASQGNKGPWRPISALIPIGITVKTVLPALDEQSDD